MILLDLSGLEEEVKKELQLLQRQVQHSKEVRRRRSEQLRRTASALDKSAKAAAASDVVSVASGETHTSTAASTVVSQAGQITVRRKAKVQGSVAGSAASGATDAAQGGGGPVNAADLKRQREAEQQRRREEKQEEEKKRKEAQKSDPAQEKGDKLTVYQKGVMGWKASNLFVVVRKTGVFTYKDAIEGRGSTSGGVTFKASASHVEHIPYEVEVENSRGSKALRKSSVTTQLSPDSHEATKKVKELGACFVVSYYDLKKGAYQPKLFEASSKAERDEWTAFLSKYVKVSS